MTDAEPAPAAPVAPAEADPNVGPCLACHEVVRVDSHGYHDNTYGIVCALYRCVSSSEREIQEAMKSLPRLVATKMFVDVEVIPILRKAGIFPKHVYVQYAGYVTIRPFDREQGLKVAGTLGHLLETKNRWAKEQEWREAFFKLSGQVKRGPLTIDLTITGVAPSESCTVEYEEVDVPARKEKRAKIVCKESEPPTVLP